MKHSRQIVLSILLSVCLLAAPVSFAQPQAPEAPSFSLVDFLSALVDDIVAIMAPASPVIDTNGAPTTDSGNNSAFEAKKDEPPRDRAQGVPDSNG
ncbi:MAG: hypothetical protein AAGM22_04275 [Acidobacteriota bacterium]